VAAAIDVGVVHFLYVVGGRCLPEDRVVDAGDDLGGGDVNVTLVQFIAYVHDDINRMTSQSKTLQIHFNHGSHDEFEVINQGPAVFAE